MKINEKLNKLACHIMAKAITNLYPKTLLADNSLDENGFFYNFKFQENISINDFDLITKEINKIIESKQPITYELIPIEEALKYFKNNKYKIDQLASMNNDYAEIIRIGDNFIDVCENLGFNSTRSLNIFQLNNLAGSYWQNDSSNDQLTRIYGVAFTDKQEKKEYELIIEEQKQRDHRKIGNDLELFTFDPLAGQGLPIWLPNGTIAKQQIERFITDLLLFYDFQFTQTPVLGQVDLYKTSGHWDHYKENMFSTIKIENDEMVLRPMTCPHQLLVYRSKPRSYRDLPFRMAEHAILHRYEASGGLTGLERVRSMTLVDTHIICKQDHIKEEVEQCFKIEEKALKALGTSIHEVHLSLHDPNNLQKFHNDEQMWKNAESKLKEILNEMHISYKEMVGEAAFYGPKIDMQVKTALGRIITLATIQLDFLLPQRFDLKYKDKDGELKTPIMIHFGVIGTFERFLAILLEQTKGVLPLWITPHQVAIIPINNDKHLDFANKLKEKFKLEKIRSLIDDSEERLSKKIRDAQIKKIPYQIIIGDNEVNSNEISYRPYGSKETFKSSIDEFVKMLKNKIEQYK